MSKEEFIIAIKQSFPKSYILKDNYGQLIIYTNMMYDENNNVVQFEMPEEEQGDNESN